MDDFLKKWKTDKKFKTSIQLATYTFFVIIVAIFAVSNSDSIPSNEIDDNKINQTEKDNKENDNTIKIPEQYNYSIKININESEKFKLKGYDIVTDLFLTPWEAALGKRVNIDSEDEIGELANSFNMMADSLEKVDLARREFISNVSHELRIIQSLMYLNQ